MILEARIALGGVAHKPWRSFGSGRFLKGKPTSVENFGRAAAIILQNAQGYAHNAFKIRIGETGYRTLLREWRWIRHRSVPAPNHQLK